LEAKASDLEKINAEQAAELEKQEDLVFQRVFERTHWNARAAGIHTELIYLAQESRHKWRFR
jgi:hypothetical protein